MQLEDLSFDSNGSRYFIEISNYKLITQIHTLIYLCLVRSVFMHLQKNGILCKQPQTTEWLGSRAIIY